MKIKPAIVAVEMRHRAEVQLRARPKPPTATGVLKSAADSQRLLHELQVHQVELEMQNAELRQARDELEAALENFTDLYDFAPVGYFTLTADGVINQVNLTGTNLVGIERARLVSRFFGTLVVPELRSIFHSFLKKVFASQTKLAMELELMGQSGQPLRAVNLEARRLLNGQECRVAVMDITARKRVEENVRVSEVRYRRLFETAHDGVLLLNPATRKITDANPFMTKLLGYTHAQLVGKELFEIGLLKDESASQEMFQKLKRDHEVRYEDLPLESKGGRHQEVEVVANLYSEDGHAVIQCNIRDITARKLAEIALNRLAAIVEFSEDAMIGKTPVGIITSWNSGAEKIFGYAAHEMVGTSIMRLIPSNRWDEEKGILAKINSGKGVKHFETLRKTKDGRLIQVSVTSSPIKDATGKIVGASKVVRDITARKQAEATQRRVEVLAASNKKLEAEIIQRLAVEQSLKQSQQLQTRLLEEARHMQGELRQLSREVLRAQEEERKRISRELHDVIAQTLTGINVRLASLKKTAGRNTTDFERNLTRTQEIVSQSVDVVHQFARELRPAVLDDLGLIPALHTFMKDFAKRTGLHTRLTAFAGVEKMDIAKRTALFRIAQEALMNVSRHAQASRVEVSLHKFASRVSMRVKDDGKSFQVQRVMQAKGRKRLGLLGMRERVEMVGGTFGVESAPGKGTIVQVDVPFTEAPKSSRQKVR
ncbi:MAG: hypothetical protein RL616_2019 [Verrucomicrobiota bacterium]